MRKRFALQAICLCFGMAFEMIAKADGPEAKRIHKRNTYHLTVKQCSEQIQAYTRANTEGTWDPGRKAFWSPTKGTIMIDPSMSSPSRAGGKTRKKAERRRSNGLRRSMQHTSGKNRRKAREILVPFS